MWSQGLFSDGDSQGHGGQGSSPPSWQPQGLKQRGRALEGLATVPDALLAIAMAWGIEELAGGGGHMETFLAHLLAACAGRQKPSSELSTA